MPFEYNVYRDNEPAPIAGFDSFQDARPFADQLLHERRAAERVIITASDDKVVYDSMR